MTQKFLNKFCVVSNRYYTSRQNFINNSDFLVEKKEYNTHDNKENMNSHVFQFKLKYNLNHEEDLNREMDLCFNKLWSKQFHLNENKIPRCNTQSTSKNCFSNKSPLLINKFQTNSLNDFTPKLKTNRRYYLKWIENNKNSEQNKSSSKDSLETSLDSDNLLMPEITLSKINKQTDSFYTVNISNDFNDLNTFSAQSEFMQRYLNYLADNNIIEARLHTFSEDKRIQILFHIMKQCNNRYLNGKEIEQLAIMNLLDMAIITHQLNLARYYARSEYGKGAPITKDKQNLVLQWLRENNFKSPDSSERRQLLEDTKMTLVQLNYQLYYLRDKWQSTKQITTENSETLLRKWINDSGIKNPNRQERDYLQKLTGYTRKQLTYRIAKINKPNGAISQASKEKLKSWIEVHGDHLPSEDEKKELLHETGWSEVQLKNQLHHLREKNGNLTIENKLKISQWLKDHSYRIPTQKEREQLRADTGLNRRQLDSFLRWCRQHQQTDP